MILIITSPDDTHLPFVTKHLTTPYELIDVQALAENSPLTYDLSKTKPIIYYKNKPLSNPTAVWLRRPRYKKGDLRLPVAPPYQDYSRTALQSHFEQLFALFQDEAFWISDYYAIMRADNKTLQLREARNLGFKVPPAVVTSDTRAAKQFVSAHPESIVKSLARRFPMPSKDKQLVFFTKKISPDSQPSYEGLHLAPAIFQNAVQTAFDIRVTVVGELVFAANIVLDAPFDGVLDWRAGHQNDSLKITPYNLPKKTADLCVALTKRLGLNFGAIDLIQDVNGIIWFIEINTNGQWAFVEEQTDQPIGKAIASLLETHS